MSTKIRHVHPTPVKDAESTLTDNRQVGHIRRESGSDVATYIPERICHSHFHFTIRYAFSSTLFSTQTDVMNFSAVVFTAQSYSKCFYISHATLPMGRYYNILLDIGAPLHSDQTITDVFVLQVPSGLGVPFASF